MKTIQVNKKAQKKTHYTYKVERFIALLLTITMFLSPIGETLGFTNKAYAAWDYVVDGISLGVSAAQCFDGEGDTVLDCSLFGLDIVLAILPFLPAGAGSASTTVKIGKTVFNRGDDIVDTLKAYSKVDDAIDAGFPILSSLDDVRAGRTTLGRYGTLSKIGNGVKDLERHHLVPQALADVLGTNVDDLTAVLVTESFHQTAFTTPLNALIKTFQLADGGYSLAGTNMVKLLNGVYRVYSGNKMLQSAAVIDILKSPAGRKWMSDAGLSLIGIDRVIRMINMGKLSSTSADDCAYVTVEDIENAMNETGLGGLNWNRKNPFSKEKISITGSIEEVDSILENAVFVPGVPDTGVVKEVYTDSAAHGLQGCTVGPNDNPDPGAQTNEHGEQVSYIDENNSTVHVDSKGWLLDEPTEYTPLPPELVGNEPCGAWSGPPD